MREYVQPTISWFGLQIEEPITALTDVLIAVVSFIAYYRIKKMPERSKVKLLLMNYFLTMGMATFLGGVLGHALQYYLGFVWKTPAWVISMISVTLLERAQIEYVKNEISKQLGAFFGWLNVIELMVFMFVSFALLNFFFVQVHAAYGLAVVVLSFSVFKFVRAKSIGSLYFIFGVIMAIIAATFYMMKWGVGPWFNHIDISNVVMAVGMWIFYLGSVKIIKDVGNDEKKEYS
ncbi:DUF6962 family protein [Parvicella tangerina]|uniref:Uncharacterized protein n=1 Tax=Parvicella tangerina TaxID=2829795 RepID=A0A916NJT7_9FLAO|nr:hypothetical protein [Parvicella tangerina]CAG5087603.1 hypothetical protein CRYO30217_03524 [Parvicella tangerina]